jgi:hypothetical protein
MTDHVTDPKVWRTRAAEMREMAANMTDEYARKTMVRIATDYEVMAGWAEGRIKRAEIKGAAPSK